jgi:hypothetical protein
MRLRRPSPALVVAGIALFIAAGGVSYAASTKPSVIGGAAPTSPAQVVGSATTAAATSLTPASFFHEYGPLLNGSACSVIAQPPTGKALIVRQVRLDTISDPSPGSGQAVEIFLGLNCNLDGVLVGVVNPSAVGQDIVTFDPGLAVPADSELSALVAGSVQAFPATDGYTVPTKQVPSSAATRPGSTGTPNSTRLTLG